MRIKNVTYERDNGQFFCQLTDASGNTHDARATIVVLGGFYCCAFHPFMLPTSLARVPRNYGLQVMAAPLLLAIGAAGAGGQPTDKKREHTPPFGIEIIRRVGPYASCNLRRTTKAFVFSEQDVIQKLLVAQRNMCGDF